MVSVDVKHHVYLLTCWLNEGNNNHINGDDVDADRNDRSLTVQAVMVTMTSVHDNYPEHHDTGDINHCLNNYDLSVSAVVWLESTCNHNSDCPSSVTNAECFDHRCLCSPGYYYSWSGNDCVASKSLILYSLLC